MSVLLALLTGASGVAAVDAAISAITWALRVRTVIKVAKEVAPHVGHGHFDVGEALDGLGNAIRGRPLTPHELELARRYQQPNNPFNGPHQNQPPT